jgi:hypothetical protein
MTCLKKYFEFPGARKIDSTVDPRKIEEHIINFIISLKKQGKGFTAINNYVSAVCKYYRKNRIVLDTKIYMNIYQSLGNQKRTELIG